MSFNYVVKRSSIHVCLMFAEIWKYKCKKKKKKPLCIFTSFTFQFVWKSSFNIRKVCRKNKELILSSLDLISGRDSCRKPGQPAELKLSKSAEGGWSASLFRTPDVPRPQFSQERSLKRRFMGIYLFLIIFKKRNLLNIWAPQQGALLPGLLEMDLCFPRRCLILLCLTAVQSGHASIQVRTNNASFYVAQKLLFIFS